MSNTVSTAPDRGLSFGLPPHLRLATTLFVVVATLALLVFRDTALAMYHTWSTTDTFGHCYLIVPIVLWMIWTRRLELTPIPVSSGPLAILMLLIFSLVWMVGELAHVLVIQQLAFVAIFPALVWLCFGRQWALAIAFPLAYLFFLVPLGQDLVRPLQLFTADFTVAALQLTGIPVFREGFNLEVPGGNWRVAEACSGLRYLIASVALGCLYAYLNYRALWRRSLFIFLAVLVPIIANGIRAYTIVLVGYASDMKYGAGAEHMVYGWVWFGIVIAGLFWVGRFWQDMDFDEQDVADKVAMPAKPAPMALLLVVALGCGAAIAGPTLAKIIEARQQFAQPELSAPQAVLGHETAKLAPEGAWQAHYPTARANLNVVYDGKPAPVQFYLAHYGKQQQGQELIDWQNVIVKEEEGQPWRNIGDRFNDIELAAGSRRQIIETQLRYGSTAHQLLVWHWYWIAGEITVNAKQAKLLELQQAARSISGETMPGSFMVAVAVPYVGDGLEQAQQQLQNFVQAFEPELATHLQQLTQ